MSLSVVIVSLALLLGVGSVSAQNTFTRPFGLPLELPPGPSTWLMGQTYGNTTGAYNYGTAWYSTGQGLHFGIDLSMPCNTPIVAVADGEAIYIDNEAFGAGPHNVILSHEEVGLTTLYGHLLQKPSVAQFQPVKRGQLLGYSGDPDLTCDSRPHLHFEVRTLDYGTAYNPINYIEAPWHVFAAIGSYDENSFELDLTNARRWMTLDDQPPVNFGGTRLNAYAQAWPPAQGNRAPAGAPPARLLDPLPENVAWSLRPISEDNCCEVFWWHPSDAARLFAVNGAPDTLASIFEWDVNVVGGFSAMVGSAPPPTFSPDGAYQIIPDGSGAIIRNVTDATQSRMETSGEIPAINPTNSQVVWLVQEGVFVPGTTPPMVQIWVSNLDGQNARQIIAQPNISARWLDAYRLLLSAEDRTLTTLSIYDTRDASTITLGTWDSLRGLSVAPGGGRVLYYRTNQPDPAEDGIYNLEMVAGAQPEKLSWFGGWRWRDSDSVYYIPFEPASAVQSLAYYHIPSKTDRRLTDPAALPFTMTNGDWDVSPDGKRIAFMNLSDRRLYVLEPLG
jgi:hypothetical protein